jgi:hypothetical protein
MARERTVRAREDGDALTEYSPDRCQVFAYMDDITIICYGRHVRRVEDLASRLIAERLGMALSPDKCLVAYAGPARSERGHHRGSFPVKTEGFLSLGVPCGTTVEQRRVLTRELLEGMRLDPSVFSQISVRAAYAILRYCVNARPGYLARVTETAEMRDLFDGFDRYVDTCLMHGLRLPVPDGPPPLPVAPRTGIGVSKHEAYLRVCLLRGLRRDLGGLGMTRYAGCDGDAACIRSRRLVTHYLGAAAPSWQPALRKWPVISVGGAGLFVDLGLPGSDPTQRMDYLDEVLREDQIDPLPSAVASAHNMWADRLLSHLHGRGDDGAAALFRSAQYGLSGSWLNAVFRTGRYVHHLAMSELEFHDALLMRLLLPAAPVSPTAAKYCHCSFRAHLPSDHSHFLDCADHRFFLDKRHNMIRDTVHSWLAKRLPACEVSKEVPYGAPERYGRRADVMIVQPTGERMWIDFAVCNPAAPTYRRENHSASAPLGAARRIAAQKYDLYRPYLDQHTRTVPFVMEATGRIYWEPIECLKTLLCRTMKDPMRDLHARCNVIIQRCNAQMAAHLRAKMAQRVAAT